MIIASLYCYKPTPLYIVACPLLPVLNTGAREITRPRPPTSIELKSRWLTWEKSRMTGDGVWPGALPSVAWYMILSRMFSMPGNRMLPENFSRAIDSSYCNNKITSLELHS